MYYYYKVITSQNEIFTSSRFYKSPRYKAVKMLLKYIATEVYPLMYGLPVTVQIYTVKRVNAKIIETVIYSKTFD